MPSFSSLPSWDEFPAEGMYAGPQPSSTSTASEVASEWDELPFAAFDDASLAFAPSVNTPSRPASRISTPVLAFSTEESLHHAAFRPPAPERSEHPRMHHEGRLAFSPSPSSVSANTETDQAGDFLREFTLTPPSPNAPFHIFTGMTTGVVVFKTRQTPLYKKTSTTLSVHPRVVPTFIGLVLRLQQIQTPAVTLISTLPLLLLALWFEHRATEGVVGVCDSKGTVCAIERWIASVPGPVLRFVSRAGVVVHLILVTHIVTLWRRGIWKKLEELKKKENTMREVDAASDGILRAQYGLVMGQLGRHLVRRVILYAMREGDRSSLTYGFFFNVRRVSLDVLGQKPGFFPNLDNRFSMLDGGPIFTLTLGAIYATSPNFIIFEMVLTRRIEDDSIECTMITPGLLRVNSQLVPDDWNGFPRPESRRGEITLDMEYDEFPQIHDLFHMDLHAHFPLSHSVPVRSVFDYGEFREIEWVDHWTK